MNVTSSPNRYVTMLSLNVSNGFSIPIYDIFIIKITDINDTKR